LKKLLRKPTIPLTASLPEYGGDKGSKIFNLTSKMKAGVIWANTYNKFDPASPFGGYKESGFGREGGLQGLMAYLKLNEASDG